MTDPNYKWLYHYWYWKTQYTMRNTGYLDLYLYTSHLRREYFDGRDCDKGELTEDEYTKWYLLTKMNEDIDQSLSKEKSSILLKAREVVRHKIRDYKVWGMVRINQDYIIDEMCKGHELVDIIEALIPAYNNPTSMCAGAILLCNIDKHNETITFKVRYQSDITAIISEVEKFTAFAKQQSRHHISKNVVKTAYDGEDYKITASLRGYIPANESGSNDDRFTIEKSKRAREILEKNASIKYETRGDISRIIGLWIWDYIQENGGTQANARRTLETFKSEQLKKLGKFEVSDRQFDRWVSRTKACIEAAEVLEIK